MPKINEIKIFSVSSENPAYPATNLLSVDHSRPWKCEKINENSAEVIFQLPTSMVICGIDVGNEFSAFIEIFVAKFGAKTHNDFKQILLSSSLMSVTECKNESSSNRVRCFAKNALIADVACKKWDLVKIICSQPFNKRLQFGLAFVTFYTPTIENESDELTTAIPKKETSSSTITSANPFSKFKLREDSPDSESETSTGLFNRWKRSKQTNESSSASNSCSATEQRQNSSQNSISPQTKQSVNPDRSDNLKQKNRNRMNLLYDEEDYKPNDKFERKIQKERKIVEAQTPKSKPHKNETNKQTESKSKFLEFLDENKEAPLTSASSTSSTSTSSKQNNKRNDEQQKYPIEMLPKIENITKHQNASDSESNQVFQKRKSSPTKPSLETLSKKPKVEHLYRPFSKLLDGIVLAISGIQNPLRADIRQKALELGAKYKPDWDSSCTHLICAFKNTPKYNQVHGIGKIVTKEWITSCHTKKKRISWRTYALDSDDERQSPSDEEYLDDTLRPAESLSSESLSSKMSTVKDNDGTSEVNSPVSNDNEHFNDGSDDPDTEDEIERILAAKGQAKKSIEKVNDDPLKKKDVYDETTDEDRRPTTASASTSDDSLQPLPEFFKGKTFFIANDVSSVDEIKLRRFITVYRGELVDQPTHVDYVLTDVSFSSSSNFTGEIVRPRWVFECDAMECLLPTKRYLV